VVQPRQEPPPVAIFPVLMELFTLSRRSVSLFKASWLLVFLRMTSSPWFPGRGILVLSVRNRNLKEPSQRFLFFTLMGLHGFIHVLRFRLS
jgi:hypothetical protein